MIALERLLTRFQTIDRRVIYAAVFVVIAIPLIYPIGFPVIVSPEVRGAYEAVQKVPDNKLVIVAVDWNAGSKGECWPQTRAAIQHLLEARKKFAIMGLVPTGPELADIIVANTLKQTKLKRTYGVDWVNWGYRTGNENMLRALVKDIPGTIKADSKGRPLNKLPLMKGIKDIHDVGLIIEITGTGLLDIYLQYIQGIYGTPMVQGCTAVVAPEQYNYLDSKQLVGLLPGMRGAAEYEKLLDFRGQGRISMDSQSFAHVLAMVLIVLGNVGMVCARRLRERGEEVT